MGGSRGREKLMTCENCHRLVPRGKAVEFEKKNVYSTDLKTSDNVFTISNIIVYYCISCAKHRKIFEKKKKIAQQIAERRGRRFE
ncbi:MAG: hypothetical protein AB1391_02160 [Candidatus Micrarchaeota archaeon]